MVPSEGWEQIITQKITIDLDRCLGCGDCAAVCPFMVYEIKKVEKGKKTKKIAVPVYQEDCFLCQSCQAQCPTDAITIDW